MAILRRLDGAAAFVAMIAAAGCELEREPTEVGPLEVPIAVHAVLRSGDDTARVVITRGRFYGNWGRPSVHPISHADVRIHGPFGSVVLQEAAPGLGRCLLQPGESEIGVDAEAGCYARVLPAAVQAGERYGLAITLPSGEVVTGETYVPTPATLSLESGGRLVVDAGSNGTWVQARIGMEWSRAPDAESLDFWLVPVAAFAGGEEVPAAACAIGHDVELNRAWEASGTGEVRIFQIYCFSRPDPEDPYRVVEVAWDSIAAVVQATAADSVYGRFMDSVMSGDALRWPRAAAGLDGAVGYFGAVAVTEVPLLLIRAKP